MQVVGQRLQGRIAFSEANRAFDVQIDVPVPPKEWGAAIRGDGGEIDRTFRAYNAAMDGRDRRAIFDLIDSRNRLPWQKHEKAGKLDDYLEHRREELHWRLKDAQIVGGFVRENQAVLLVKASNPVIGRYHGQVALAREDGRWKVGEEVYQVGE